MTSLLSTWLNGSNFISEYAAVAPTSPEADASFIHHITCNTHKNNEEGENRAKRQMSKSSYSNEDFDGSSKSKPGSNRTWNDAALDIGQWTTSAAGSVASTIVSTTKQLSSQLSQTPTPSSTATERSRAYVARGIDRDYLHSSPHHPDIKQGSIGGYLGDLANRFTAPKVHPTKAKWIE